MTPQAYVGIGAVLIVGGVALPLAAGVPIWMGLIVGLIGLALAVRAVMADSSGNSTLDQAEDGQRVPAADDAVPR